MRTLFLIAVLVGGMWKIAIAQTNHQTENPRPNVVVFLSDDQGYGDFSHTGNQDLATPHIDSLARDGAYVANFYVCPVCSPTRAEFLTGRYHPRGGVYSTSAGGERLDLDESTIAEAFQSAGYATAAFGKWHNGTQAPYHPTSRGFDEYYGFCSGHWGHYFSPMLEHNGELVRGEGFVIDDFTNHAIKFIEDHQDQPFFVYLPYNTPHSPMQVPDPYWEKFKDKQLTQLPADFHTNKRNDKGINHARCALAMCENIDDNVGRVLAKLDELKLADNTIVMYFCDNGPNGPRYNAGLKGRKGSTDEGGVHSPLFVRWPATIHPGRQIDVVCGAIDLFPTLMELCGISDFEPAKPFDGISIAPEIQTAGVNREPRFLFSHWNNKISVRDNRYRLDHKGVLYDLIEDPGQTSPVTDRPNINEQMQQAIVEFKTNVLGELDRDRLRRFPIGHASMQNTQLPARDATATGQIKRSNRFPNDSYFTNWVDTSDEIMWPVEVLQGGRYAVDVYYCLDAGDTGTRIRLSLDDAWVEKTIDQPNESPLIGGEQDRSERAESYVKDFKPVSLGVIELPAGPGDLKLQTTSIPGDESIEFRLLMLKRLGE